ncbi:MAG TPA: ATP-binding protein [Accumulibacter sp.]|uniref:sensor histidine kinase n=1 Tax=Accumulibacter sp. TaxID=2053492 RepID=UPI002879799B|nr:ATP-binding protein [Accumulibacter sp.]MDS4053504.1 ATP-binding protein [Accumulibacter sp.]HMV06616.1 ATP-binding protein [Accumulibacter sp.]HMW62740.1 ATP-binding protein [Accumulibacter sp.]HMW79050.1 ATP-binding protein [Accumulibacter sp.]HMX69825.1 ATP-binding protein [Accumulibacter sp.]
MRPVDQPAPFNLLRWFAWLSPLVIAMIALANAWLISRFLNEHLFQREASISRDFVQTILLADESVAYLAGSDDAALRGRFRESIAQLSKMPDVLRANVFAADGSILWSSNPDLVGKRFADNDELVQAMRGELVVHAGRIARDERQKREHEGLDPSVQFFVETYIPLVAPGGSGVLGVVEIYKAPLALSQAIREGQTQVGLAALASALALYLSLFWLIQRADRTIKLQHARLLDAETLAVIGELTAAVAHNIRNPLASIRSAAELSLDMPLDDCTEQARDIIREVDRISGRITELLRLSGQEVRGRERVDLAALLQRCVIECRSSFAERGMPLSFECRSAQAWITADPALLQQAFLSLLSNAAEAMRQGGTCQVIVEDATAKEIRVVVADSGCGITPESIGQVLRPFFTSKPQGLGLGLPFAKRIVERFGGRLSLSSVPGEGTEVQMFFPRA